jgi:hypothetical protein
VLDGALYFEMVVVTNLVAGDDLAFVKFWCFYRNSTLSKCAVNNFKTF